MNTKPVYLLVDEIKYDGVVASTKDIKKVFYNIELMGTEVEQDIAIRIRLVEEYLSVVNRFGRFILVIRIKRDETFARMDLFDHRAIPNEKITDVAMAMFGKYPGLAEQFIKHYEDLRSRFSSEMDAVELLLS